MPRNARAQALLKPLGRSARPSCSAIGSLSQGRPVRGAPDPQAGRKADHAMAEAITKMDFLTDPKARRAACSYHG
jgi:hypothetical protein